MNVTMSLSALTARLSDVEGTHGNFTAVSLCDTPDHVGNEVSFFVKPDNAAMALRIADAFREAALRHMPAQQPEEVSQDVPVTVDE